MQQSVTTSSVSLPGTTALTKAVRPLPSAADTAAVEMCTSDNSAPGWEGQVVLMPHAPSQPARRVIGGLRAQCVQASNVNLKLELTDERRKAESSDHRELGLYPQSKTPSRPGHGGHSEGTLAEPRGGLSEASGSDSGAAEQLPIGLHRCHAVMRISCNSAPRPNHVN